MAIRNLKYPCPFCNCKECSLHTRYPDFDQRAKGSNFVAFRVSCWRCQTQGPQFLHDFNRPTYHSDTYRTSEAAARQAALDKWNQVAKIIVGEVKV